MFQTPVITSTPKAGQATRLNRRAAARGTSGPMRRRAGTSAASVSWPPTQTVAASTCKNSRTVSAFTVSMTRLSASGSVGARHVLRNLPDVPARVGEARGADSPRSVYRAIEQLDAALGEFRADGVDIIGAQRQHEARARAGAGDDAGLDQLGGCRCREQVDDGVL